MNEKPIAERRIMLIVWKWNQFHSNRVNDKYLEKAENKKYLKNISKGKGIFYDEYAVDNSAYSKDSLVVATYIYNGDNSKQVLSKLIELYEKEDAKLMIFLHRGNFYKEPDVVEILKKHPNVDKCFLFADGRDYIYYHAPNKGMLDDSGGFKINRPQKIKVFDRSEKTVQQPYFDYVWRYYEHEFRRKILELKQDLFGTCGDLVFPHQAEFFDKLDLAQRIEASDDKCLKIRLKSFLGKYDDLKYRKETADENIEKYEKMEEEIERLTDYEKKEKSSFIFDDCRANLMQHDNPKEREVRKLYDQLVHQMKDIFLNCNSTNRQIHKQEIRDVRNLFGDLINNLPEVPPL